MTARSGDPGVSPESSSAAAAAGAGAGAEIWGTSEDLLLACAVSRHGTASWDAVAKEMQSRCPSAAGFTPATCRLRFRVLHRRFSGGGGVTAENEDTGGEEEPDAAAVAGWVEELRKLRVAELRREVEKYDLSIGSLQSKVKRLTEERERSISGETKPAAAAKEEEGEEDVRKGSPEEAGAVEDRVSGHESGRSCKESNSSDLKRPENDPAAAADDDRETGEEAAAAAASAGEVALKEEASGESVAGSKEAEAEKESSDVQSSASPSRRRRLKGGGGEEAEAEEASPSPSVSVPLPAAEAEPLVAFLESVRTSKAGAVFERRLESQEGERYSGTIRRHVDLEMVQSKLVGGAAAAAAAAAMCYASASEFYRDMMLLCTNALVFFPRGSPEHAAAIQLRALVSKQISKDRQPPAGKAPAAAEAKKPKADADIAGPLLEKAPIIVCRKRSSIAKAAAAAAKGEKAEKAEKEKKDGGEEKKKAVATMTTVTAAAAAKDKKARGMRTNKSRGPARNQKMVKVSESSEGTKKSDKKGGGGGGGSSSSAAAAGGVAKKRNAVDFLNRMNQNGSPSTERVSLLETLKLSVATEQQKKSSSSSGKGDGRKEAGGSGSKKGAASTPPGRRIGRPPKRAAAPPTPPPSKRAKDDKPTRKRGKK
uniref:Bromo domain-containing protein n=1 Tax=Oryza punctata TaxID=4537 RepID=A0A0E0LWR7_ORYPU